LHPYLLASTSTEKRRQIGLLVLSEEQEELERLQQEEYDKARKLQSPVIKTRRAMEAARKEQRKQIKALNSTES